MEDRPTDPPAFEMVDDRPAEVAVDDTGIVIPPDNPHDPGGMLSYRRAATATWDQIGMRLGRVSLWLALSVIATYGFAIAINLLPIRFGLGDGEALLLLWMYVTLALLATGFVTACAAVVLTRGRSLPGWVGIIPGCLAIASAVYLSS